ncbi:MAG: DUF58 domain-containing protein [Elusimicrobia bacterium]|nr:DUF58 domain-containing protein [Elusimicrobiota bacterium]
MSFSDSTPLTTADVLKRVRTLEITARRLVNDTFAGQYSSTFKGRGMEFSEVREYLPGDDVRAIDWNVTARTGHPYIKKFVEERELTILFLVDASRSLRFGTRSQLKAELAAEITAVLAFSALANNDKTGLVLFSDRVEKYIPPRKSRGHILRLVRDVLEFTPQNQGTSLKSALDFVSHVQRRRAVVFLISDFMDDGYQRPLAIAQRRHDLIAVPVEDRWEKNLPARGRWLLEDAETGRVRVVNAPREGRAFARAQIERRNQLDTTFRRAGVDSIYVETGRPYTPSFLRFFRERAKRMH